MRCRQRDCSAQIGLRRVYICPTQNRTSERASQTTSLLVRQARQAGRRARWLRQSPHMLPGSRDHEESTNKPRARELDHRPFIVFAEEASHGSVLGLDSTRLLISRDEQSLIVSAPRDDARLLPLSSSVFCTSDGHLYESVVSEKQTRANWIAFALYLISFAPRAVCEMLRH